MKKIIVTVCLLIFLALSACSGRLEKDKTPRLESEDENALSSDASDLIDEAYPGYEIYLPISGYPVESEPEFPVDTAYPIETETGELSLEAVAEIVVQALSIKDLITVLQFVHPVMGVRFSPYTHVEEAHLKFLPQELSELVESDEVYRWGEYDGSGDPIELTFDEYYDRFLFSAFFAEPEMMAVNEELGHSSMINNIAEFYPGSSFVEYHFSGFEEKYEGMDWVSLRLVFLQEGGRWYLVGLVNDQWTT